MSTAQQNFRILQLLKTNPVLGNFELLSMLKQEAKEQIEVEMEALKATLFAQIEEKINLQAEKLSTSTDVFKHITSLKGESGYSPILGTDYFTDTDIEAMIIEVNSRIPIPQDGIDGKDGSIPVAGIDYPSKEEIRNQVLKQVDIAVSRIPKAENGKTPLKGVDYFTEKDIQDILQRLKLPEEITGRQIVEKVNELEIRSDLQIDAQHIKNLPRMVKEFAKRAIHRGGGRLVVDNFTSNTDGSTKIFTLSAVPGTSNVLVVSTTFPVIYDPAVDFTVVGQTLTLTGEVPAPPTGQVLVAVYTN